MQYNRRDFSQYTVDLLRELAARAITLDLTILAYLLLMAAQEAGDIDV